jgi:hypothetical protein
MKLLSPLNQCATIGCIALALVLFGCSSDKPSEMEEVGQIHRYKESSHPMQTVVVEEPLFPFSLVFPVEGDLPSALINNSFGRLEVQMGKSFSYWVTQEECRLNRKFAQWSEGIFTLTPDIDNDSTLHVRLALPDGSGAFYHFAVCKNLNGIPYLFTSDQRMVFNKAQTDQMMAYIHRSFE